METYYSHSPEETEEIAANFAKTLSGGTVVAYRGDLGMGKTCFTRGLALGLGSTDTVTSPTFALVNEYLSGTLPLYHFDMYRISGWEDLYSTGFFDYIEQGGVLACEWSENIENALPENTVFVKFERLSDTERKITIENWGENMDEETAVKYNHNLTNRLNLLIMAVNGITDRNYISDFIRKMPVKDSTALRKYMTKNEPGIDYNITIERPASLGGGSYQTFLQFDQFLFLNISD